MSQLPKLTRPMRNISRSNALVYADVSTPPSTEAREAYGHPIKIGKFKKLSVIAEGDTLNDKGTFYLCGSYSNETDKLAFRLIEVPFRGTVRSLVVVRDKVTNMPRGEDYTEVVGVYYAMTPLKDVLDVTKHDERKSWQVLTGYPLKVNDVIDGKRVDQVTTEFGVVRAMVI